MLSCFCCFIFFLFASLPANVGVHTGGLAAAGAIPCPVMEGLEPGALRDTREVTLNLLGGGGGFSRGSMGAALHAKSISLGLEWPILVLSTVRSCPVSSSAAVVPFARWRGHCCRMITYS